MAEELYLDTSMRFVPQLSLAKLVTMSFGPSDNPRLEKFEMLMVKDSSDEALQMMTVKSSYKDVNTSKVRKNI